jgi:Uncharacterized protein conserved in bacteria (DUF2059)
LDVMLTQDAIPRIRRERPAFSDADAKDFRDRYLKAAEIVLKRTWGEYSEYKISLYAKHFSDKEVIQLIEFYSTPLGRKVSITLPKLMQESMTTGASYGKKIAPLIEQEFLYPGFQDKSNSPAPLFLDPTPVDVPPPIIYDDPGIK